MAELNFNAKNVKPFEEQVRKPEPARSWSQYQTNIFNFVEHGTGNAIVTAVAGSGKTTTGVEAVKRVKGSHIFLAFNKSIAEELKAREVNARTFHSLTYGPVCQSKGARSVEADKLRRLCDANLKGNDGRLYSAFICRLVGLARQIGIGVLVQDTPDAWLNLCMHHDLEPDNDFADIGKGIELASELLQWSNESSMVDFDDLLYLAVRNNISLPKFDFVFVDEAQDTNAIQRALLHKLMRGPNARLIAVGDPAQAIYGFRGADSESMNMIRKEFRCADLPLSITYRCPTSVVTMAQTWVNHIQAADNASEGLVETLNRDWNTAIFKAEDLIVCRKTAPLLSLAFRFMRERIPAQVMGREIGQGLKTLIKKLNASSLADLYLKLNSYKDREIEKAMAKKDDAKAEAIEDKVFAVQCLIDSMGENEKTIDALMQTIDTLFADKRNAVTLATIHKSKGLEANRVYWLNSSECPSQWARQEWQREQERNLCYVAVTRAKQELYLIEL